MVSATPLAPTRRNDLPIRRRVIRIVRDALRETPVAGRTKDALTRRAKGVACLRCVPPLSGGAAQGRTSGRKQPADRLVRQ